MSRLYLLLLFLLPLSSQLQSAISPEREDLLLLVQERSKMFDAYSASLSKKSGFFGQRTKNDMRDSQDKLQDIVRLDNRIMSSLNRLLDYKNFEKINLSYDASRDAQRLQSLSQTNDTLLKQIVQLENEKKELKKSSVQYRVYLWLFWIIVAGIFIRYFKKRRMQGGKE